jgi:hypothetical protein
MPLFLCRWPNGDCSVLWARNKEDAVEVLDQVGNVESPSWEWRLPPIAGFHGKWRRPRLQGPAPQRSGRSLE